MGRAQKLKQQRREEERLKELEKFNKRKKALLWSIIGTLAACVVALVLVVVLVRLPTYINQMVVEVTGKGTFIVEMKEDEAPETCAHIEAMVRNGSFKGANFYQVMEEAVFTGTQGRDTTAGGGAETINKRGAVGMAKPSDQTGTPLPDSATNEFYLLKQDTPSLDPNFTIFGQVAEGMDIVDALTPGTVINSISLDEGGGQMLIEQDSGMIVIELDTEGAPQTVQHLADLVNSGFYSDMNWYRVEDFVVQTGSHARSLEQAGADADAIQRGSERDSGVGTVVDEIGYEGPVQDPEMLAEEQKTVPMEGKLPAVRGAVMLYWQPENSSAQSQTSFMPDLPTEFVVLKKDLSEDIGTGLTVFGEVVEGMDVVDLIQQGDVVGTIYIREVRKD